MLTLRVPLPERKYPDVARRVLFFEQLLPAMASVPGVTAAAVNTSTIPSATRLDASRYRLDGEQRSVIVASDQR